MAKKYKVRVIYKSGAQMDFNASEFSIENGVWTWSNDAHPRPMLLGVNDIAAVWQLTT